MKVLPAWKYGDPAIVAECVELTALRAQERARIRSILREEELRAATRVRYGLISAATALMIKRARIQELVLAAMKERK